jgi:hypothetical protein
MSIQFRRDKKGLRVPFLVAGGFFRVRSQPVGLEAFHSQAGNVLDGDVQDGMFGH